jgi:ubiquinone/menaquinone biosynthesis C-methylase UbiE
MTSGSSFKNAVRANYDLHAAAYAAGNRMQSENLRKLLRLMQGTDGVPKNGRLLDLGCGDGALLSLLTSNSESSPYAYMGVDASIELINLAKRQHGSLDAFQLGDAEKLEFADGTFEIVVSNSVLHWLNVPEEHRSPELAFREVYRVLAPGGVLAASIAGDGTARRFLKAYRTVMNRKPSRRALPGTAYRADPIGSMKLWEVVDLLQISGFNVSVARMDFEPVFYETPSDYVADVRAYGSEMFMATVADLDRADLWRAICEEFQRIVGSHHYLHDQYMNYVVAVKSNCGV